MFLLLVSINVIQWKTAVGSDQKGRSFYCSMIDYDTGGKNTFQGKYRLFLIFLRTFNYEVDLNLAFYTM